MNSNQALDASQSVQRMIGFLSASIFMVYAASLITKLILSEYNQHTILMLFAYPINRKKIIGVKIGLIAVFTLISTFITCLIAHFYVTLVNQYFVVIADPFRLTSNVLLSYLYCSLLVGLLSFCPFIIGMIKKSTIATMVTAVLGIIAIQTMMPRTYFWHRSFLLLLIVGVIVALSSYPIFQKKIVDFDS